MNKLTLAALAVLALVATGHADRHRTPKGGPHPTTHSQQVVPSRALSDFGVVYEREAPDGTSLIVAGFGTLSSPNEQGCSSCPAHSVTTNQPYIAEWKDANGVSHKVTTHRLTAESVSNHAWRHRGYVKSAMHDFPPATPTVFGSQQTKAPLFSSTWTDADGIQHTVNTDPEDPTEDPEVTSALHERRLNALKSLFPPA